MQRQFKFKGGLLLNEIGLEIRFKSETYFKHNYYVHVCEVLYTH